jgi:hypothetical protein
MLDIAKDQMEHSKKKIRDFKIYKRKAERQEKQL